MPNQAKALEKLHTSVQIGNVTLQNRVLIAPLAGYTDAAFRHTLRALGAGLCYTEMVSCKGLVYGNEKTEELLTTTEIENPKAVQVFGSDAEIMRRAAELPSLEKFDILDINMGCPVPKVVKNGEGSALLDRPQVAERIVKELASLGRPVTVKMRIGRQKNKLVTRDFALRMQDAGAAAITVHGRVAEDYYAGEPNYGEIAAAVQALTIPVFANGGIFSAADAAKMLCETGAAGVMLARGAMLDPCLVCDLLGAPRPSFLTVIEGQLQLLRMLFGEGAAIGFRKQFSAYLWGITGAKRFRESIFTATTIEQMLEIARAVDWENRTAH